MDKEIKKIVTKKKVYETTFVISSRVYNLFREWLSCTKLSPQKHKILNLLENESEPIKAELIANKLRISAPLLSYHINGNLHCDGLINIRLIESHKLSRGQIGYKLTSLGKEIMAIMKDIK